MVQVSSVTSRTNPLMVRLRKLSNDPLAYRKQGQIWLEGEHLCGAYAARGGRVEHAVITESAWAQVPGRDLALGANAITVVPASLMATLSTLESSPSLAFAVDWAPPRDLQAGSPSVVLDRVQDAGNVGTILRSAAAFGFTQVLALKGCAGLWTPKVLRAGMGAHFGLHLMEALDETALAGITVPLLAALPRASVAIHELRLPWPCAWVFGHEGQGIHGALIQRCAHGLRIPQPGGEESLNVAAAAAVCLYESMRQRLEIGSLPIG